MNNFTNSFTRGNKAKRTLDRLSILTTSHVEVIRDDELKEIDIDQIVLDDYIVLTTGAQIPTDSINNNY